MPQRTNSMYVDGNNLAYRFDSALNLDWQGQRVGAIYGIVGALRQWRSSSRYDKSNIVFFWDQGHAKERLEVLPTYKQKKERTEAEQEAMKDFYHQTNVLRSLLPMMGCSCVYGPGMECDDLLATWVDVTCAADPQHEVMIVSGDSDYQQLVNDRVSILTPDSHVLHAEQVLERHGVLPALIPQMKALTGDGSDSIPGIPGVGPKRALGLLMDYHSLTTLDKTGFAKEVEQLDKPTKKYAQLVLDNWNVYIRNYMLIKLPSELVKLDRSKIVKVKPCLNKAAVKQMFINLGFASLLARFTDLWESIEDAAK